jgi:hypothetical protein
MTSAAASLRSKSAGPQTAPSPASGPEILRSCTLVLVTALVVARPMLLGEDPGLLLQDSEPSGMVVTLLWLVAALGWAGWRAWSRETRWYGGLVEAALLVFVILTFYRAGATAAYKHPALLIAWEWAALLVAFFLVRQLVRTPREQQGLLAALLATGVSLSAYGVHQYFVTLPRTRAQYLAEPTPRDRPEFIASLGLTPGVPLPAAYPWAALAMSTQKEPLLPLQKRLAQSGIFLDADDPLLENWARRLAMDHVFSRYAHPNSFAGFLVLLLPAAAGCTYAGWRSGRPGWQTALAGGGGALLGLALWLTHSRGAFLGLLVGAGICAALYGRQLLRSHPRALTAGLVGLTVLVLMGYLMLRSETGAAALGKEPGTARARLDYWAATWKMIREHTWSGVGPGQFGRLYPRYMTPTASEQVSDPHNFILETWATTGLLGLAALLTALGAFFVRAQRVERGPRTEPEPRVLLGWEFYVGGMAGLLLGFLLWTSGRTGDEIILEGVVWVVVAFFWFGSFALFDGIAWTGPARTAALTAGVAALLLNLTVSGGISFPSVAQPLWIMAALVLATLPEPARTWPGEGWLGRVAPVPLCLTLGLVYFSTCLYPVTAGHNLARRGLERSRLLWQQTDVTEDKVVKDRPDVFLIKQVLPYLERAAQEDPGNAQHHLQLAAWYGEVWKYRPTDLDLNKRAVMHAQRVHGLTENRQAPPGLDPESKEGFLAEYRLRMLFADRQGPLLSEDPKTQAGLKAWQNERYRAAARMLREVVRRDPTSVRYRYQLADVLFRLDPKSEEGLRQARQARDLDAKATVPVRKLTDRQREQVRKWLEGGSAS